MKRTIRYRLKYRDSWYITTNYKSITELINDFVGDSSIFTELKDMNRWWFQFCWIEYSYLD